MAIPQELPTLSFASVPLWEQWLFKPHDQLDGVWIKMAKKASGVASVTHDEALYVARCYGWIDGQRNSSDDRYFLQKFTPRRPRSLWSKRNIDKVAMRLAAGKMQPAWRRSKRPGKTAGGKPRMIRQKIWLFQKIFCRPWGKTNKHRPF